MLNLLATSILGGHNESWIHRFGNHGESDGGKLAKMRPFPGHPQPDTSKGGALVGKRRGLGGLASRLGPQCGCVVHNAGASGRSPGGGTGRKWFSFAPYAWPIMG